jgi:flavin reductase (DIM6/NTAB) family NADH-FMN oxidoreductase RutF
LNEQDEMTSEKVQELTRQAMRKLASSVAVVTAQDAEARQAMTATSVTSLSLEPPSLLVCINKSAAIYPLLLAKQPFAVNILSRAQERISELCGGGEQGDRFSEGTWEDHVDGPPMLADSQANLICACDGFLEYGSHGIFVGRITDIKLCDTIDPLIYVDGKYTSTCD